MDSSSVTRINFDFPDEEYALIVKHLPKGVRGEVMRCMCRMLIRDLVLASPEIER